MAKKKQPGMDVGTAFSRLGDQFRNLDTQNPWSWPAAPRYLLLLVIAAVVAGALWYFWARNALDELEVERQNEEKLRTEFSQKVKKAASLELLKAQKVQVQQYVALLEKQLPSKAEMDALLSDINQAGLGRSLQFELFRPQALVVKEYYAELPIALRVTGQYHDIGAFTSDIAHLSRIVTLNNLSLKPKDKSGGTLVLEATAKTFRYLDEAEQEQQQSAKGGKSRKK